MKLKSLSHPIIFVITLLCQHTLCKDEPVTADAAGSTVRIEVLPESINELITEEISLTCTPQDLPLGTKAILFMELGKEGEHPLATVKGPTLELGTDLKNNMQAKGQIAKNVSQSYLQLTIKRPFVDDVNVYCCRMFYQNEFGELKIGHVYADVSIENSDKAVFVHLLGKVSDLEKYTHDLESAVLKQENYTHDLESAVLKQENYTKDLENALLKQENYTKDLEETVKEQGKQLMDQEAKDAFTSAFSVYGTKKTFNSGETLVFLHYILNIGDHYNLATGVFTSPRKGLYVFHLSVMAASNNDFAVMLKVNDEFRAALSSRDSNYYDHSSLGTVLSLEIGDTVRPEVRWGTTLHYLNDKFTVFNGYLSKLL